MGRRKVKSILENGRNMTLMKGETRRKDGMYIYSYTDKDHKRRFLSSSTLVGLRKKEAELDRDRIEHIRTDKSRMSLNEAHVEWRNTITVEETTASNYDWIYQAYTEKVFGKKPIGDITEYDVIKYYKNLLTEKHLSVATVDNLQTVLQQVFIYAVKCDYIRKNVCEGIMKPLKKQYKKSKEVVALSQAEQARLLSYLKTYDEEHNSHWYPLFAFMMTTGLRVGETAGLQWEDIELDEETVTGTINIRHNLVYYKNFDERHMKWSIHPPKSIAGKRSFKLSNIAVEALLMQKKLNLSYKGEPIDGFKNFVFVNKQGLQFQQGPINRTLSRIITAANIDAMEKNENGGNIVIIRPISSHALRRTFITRCAEAGLNIKVTMKMVGHSDMRTTMDIYTMVGKDWEADEIDKYNKHMGDKM